MGNKQPSKTKRFFNDFTIDSISVADRNESDEVIRQSSFMMEFHEQLKSLPMRNEPRAAIAVNPLPISHLNSSDNLQWKQCVAQYYLHTRYEFPKKKKTNSPKNTIENRDLKSRSKAKSKQQLEEKNSHSFSDIEEELKIQIFKFQLDQFKFPAKKRVKKKQLPPLPAHQEYDLSFDDFLSVCSNTFK